MRSEIDERVRGDDDVARHDVHAALRQALPMHAVPERPAHVGLRVRGIGRVERLRTREDRAARCVHRGPEDLDDVEESGRDVHDVNQRESGRDAARSART